MLSSLDLVRELYVRPSHQRDQKPAVAVCVTGMQSRLMPTNLVTNIVAPNPMYSFDVIYVLDEENELYYSSGAGWTYEPSPMANLGPSQLHTPSSVPRRPCRLARRPPCRPLPPCHRTVPRPVPFVPPSDALPAVCCRRAALPPTLAALLSARPSLR